MADNNPNAAFLEQMREDFLVESQEILDRLGPLLTELEQVPTTETINTIFREIHTLKGTAGFVGLESIGRLAHKLEDVFGEVRANRLAATPELIDTALAGVQLLIAMRNHVLHGEPEGNPDPLIAQLDDVLQGKPVTLSGSLQVDVSFPQAAAITGPLPAISFEPEAQPPLPNVDESLVELPVPGKFVSGPLPSLESIIGEGGGSSSHVSKPESTLRVETETLNTLMTLTGELITVRNSLVARAEVLRDDYLEESVNALSRLTRQLQTVVSSVRLVPIERLFNRFTPVVRNLARGRGTHMTLVAVGGETLLDRTIIEQMYDPIMHMLRNSADHGLESPEDRLRAGKPESATLTLSAERRGDHVILCVGDDGRGIDPVRVRQVAVDRGVCLSEEAALLTDEQAIRLIFAPGFSTATSITDLSGRGVGMDVVRQNVRRLRGSIDIESQVGQGTRFILKLPLTLAILQVLLVRVGPYIYALPLHVVRETLLVSAEMIQTVQHQAVILIRDKVVPVHFLKELLHQQPGGVPERATPAVVTHLARGDGVLVVDELVGKQQIVIKPLGPYLGTVRGVEGSALLPDGSVTLVLEVEGLLA